MTLYHEITVKEKDFVHASASMIAVVDDEHIDANIEINEVKVFSTTTPSLLSRISSAIGEVNVTFSSK